MEERHHAQLALLREGTCKIQNLRRLRRRKMKKKNLQGVSQTAVIRASVVVNGTVSKQEKRFVCAAC